MAYGAWEARMFGVVDENGASLPNWFGAVTDFLNQEITDHKEQIAAWNVVPYGQDLEPTLFVKWRPLISDKDAPQSSMELEEYPTDPTLPFALGMTEPHNHGLGDDEQPDKGAGG